MKEKFKYFFSACPPHFFIICACVFMQMLNWGEGYRFVFHLNLLMVLVSSFYLFDKVRNHYADISYLLAFPIIFLVLHLFSGVGFVYSGEIRSVIFATFLMLGIWLLSLKDIEYITKNIFGAATTLLLLYVVSQTIALWWFDKPYGTMRNPHYLAFNSAAALIVAIYLFSRASFLWKLLFGLCVILLGAFILGSSSRPTWIGLICSGLLVIFFVERKYRYSIALAIISVLIGLMLSNIAGFADKFMSLIVNLANEERVQIWQDVWRMQMDSSLYQWLVGHGLNTFEDNFISYSAFHSMIESMDFHSPHNFILEVLYLSGTLGLVLSFILIFLLYKNLLSAINNNSELKSTYLLLFALLTTNLVTVGITVSFFSRYNLTMIAIVVGGMLIMRKIPLRKTI